MQLDKTENLNRDVNLTPGANSTILHEPPWWSYLGFLKSLPFHDLNIEMGPDCISAWTKPWSNRSARVTLLVDIGNRFAVVTDSRNGFWFLPGGGVEPNESIEEAAKREAVEELGLEVKVGRVITTFAVTLISKDTRERLKIPPFVVVHATPTGGQLKKKYAPNRKILLVRKDECNILLENLKVLGEYEWMKPYFCVSRETVREFLR